MKKIISIICIIIPLISVFLLTVIERGFQKAIIVWSIAIAGTLLLSFGFYLLEQSKKND